MPYFWDKIDKFYITLVEKENAIHKLCFGKCILENDTFNKTSLLNQGFLELREYFDGKRQAFDLPLFLEGTDFQKKVWYALLTIPYGTTITYKQLAEKIGNVKAVRAVGMANHSNPLALFVPCHRVIGSNGKLVGYAGGLELKEYLLSLENKYQK